MWGIIWLGGLALALLGGLLALTAALLPRAVARLEGPAQEPLTNKVAEAAIPAPAEPTAPPVAAAPERAAAPRPLPPRFGPAPDEHLVAAAIALALSFYQQEAAGAPMAAGAPGGGSNWALAGRWQAMQKRQQTHKR
jgi:hypothetical protein